MKEEIIEMMNEVCEEDISKDLDMNLWDTGLIDSLSVAEMLFDIEDRFGIIISPTAITNDDISTPNKIIQMIESRK